MSATNISLNRLDCLDFQALISPTLISYKCFIIAESLLSQLLYYLDFSVWLRRTEV